MDFAALPPEINSGRMYAGPGSGPMVAAAVAWDGLAAELYSAAYSYHSAVAGLTSGAWLGPSSASMAAAASTNVAWMTTTAAQAEHVAAQAKAAAAAFEAAFAMTVPPPVIAANRSLLASLVATNILGQNTPAITATEAHYMEMWAQDVAAMYGYASASATATTMTPFTPPPSTTNSAGLASQAAAVSEAAGTSAGSAQTTLSQLISAVPAALQGLASPAASTSGLSGISDGVSLLQTLEGPVQIVALAGNDVLIPPAATLGFTSGVLVDVPAASGLANAVGSATAPTAAALVGEATPFGSAGIGISSGAVTAGWGNAASIGALSVPQAWTPAIRPAAFALPDTTIGDAAASNAAGPAVLGGLPRTGASVRAKRGIICGDGIHPLKVIPLLGYTG
jgi:PPE-repeat protein